MLSSLVPLERDVGVDAEWWLLAGDPTFFEVTKKLHNGLQGMPCDLDDQERSAYLRLNEDTARVLGDEWDVVVAHDPQRAAIRSFARENGARWLWRSHVDTSEPDAGAWEFLRPFVEAHDLAAFTLKEFAPPDLRLPIETLVPAIGSMATDDPQGWRIYQGVQEAALGQEGFFLFTDQMGVTHHEVNSLQRVADVVVQKSTREGFGLIVSETLWKGTPMVAGRAGGIPGQLQDGRSGYLAETVDEFVGRVVELLQDPVLAKELGTAGVRRVRERFLMPRLLRDRLLVLRELTRAGSRPNVGALGAARRLRRGRATESQRSGCSSDESRSPRPCRRLRRRSKTA